MKSLAAYVGWTIDHNADPHQIDVHQGLEWGTKQRRCTAIAHSYREAYRLECAFVGHRLGYEYWRDHVSVSKNEHDLALVAQGVVGFWVSPESGFSAKGTMVKRLSIEESHVFNKEQARKDDESIARNEEYQARLGAEIEARQRGYRAKTGLVAAALNMHVEFPKGATEREDAYIRLHEAVQEYEKQGG